MSEENSILLQVGVKILIKNDEEKYLLLKRNPEAYPGMKAKWDIVGGRIDNGSSLLDNLRRETMEESGLELVGEPKLLGAQDILKVPGRHIVRLTYVGKASGEIVLSHEHTEYKWFSLDEMKVLEREEFDSYAKALIGTGVLG